MTSSTHRGTTPGAVRYEIDADDRIVCIDSRWLRFARDNAGEDLTEENVVGRRIWDFVAGAETRHLYGVLYDRVRARRRPVRVPFRCDSPTVRRHMELAVSPTPADGIAMEGRMLRRETRAAIPLLDPSIPRSGDLARMCSWCKRIEVGDEGWMEPEAAIARLGFFSADAPPRLTHGACEDCEAEILREIRSPVDARE